MSKHDDGVKDPVPSHGRLTDNLRFADDIDLIQKKMQQDMNNLHEAGRRAGLRVNTNVAKTKTLVFGSRNIEKHRTI